MQSLHRDNRSRDQRGCSSRAWDDARSKEQAGEAKGEINARSACRDLARFWHICGDVSTFTLNLTDYHHEPRSVSHVRTFHVWPLLPRATLASLIDLKHTGRHERHTTWLWQIDGVWPRLSSTCCHGVGRANSRLR